MFDDLTNNNQDQNGGQKNDELSNFENKPQPNLSPNQNTFLNRSNMTAENNFNEQPKIEIEDMFSEVENKEKPAIFQPKTNHNESNEIDPSGHNGSHKIKKLISLLVLSIGLLLLGSAGYWGYGILSSSKDEIIIKEDNTSSIEEEIEQEIITNEEIIEEENFANDYVSQDADQDGLSDNEEEALGTNINNADSDNDGLFDREEVKVYNTNPLNSDSDGDGKKDGEEVRSGQNPNGDGSLYDTGGADIEVPPVKQIEEEIINIDTDGDGLFDQDEISIYKTDPNMADTDGDELDDNDEIMIYKTDPLKMDTDGDSYSDGLEIKSGYSPLGPGKLLE